MCERKIVIGGRGCQVYGDETAKNVIFWFTGEHEKDTIEEVYQQLKEMTQVSFCLITCEIEDWNAQLSPWSAPAVYGKEGFAGEGAETLEWLEKECLPGLENIYEAGREKTIDRRIFIVWIICNVGFLRTGDIYRSSGMFCFLLVPRLDGVYETAYGTQEEQNLLEPWNQGREDQKSRYGNSRGGCQRHVSAAV